MTLVLYMCMYIYIYIYIYRYKTALCNAAETTTLNQLNFNIK